MINWTDFLSAEKRLILQQPKNDNEPTYVGIDNQKAITDFLFQLVVME
jgi:hypothetical protein